MVREKESLKTGITEKFFFTFFVYLTDFITVLLLFTVHNSTLFYSTEKSCFAILCVLFIVSFIFFCFLHFNFVGNARSSVVNLLKVKVELESVNKVKL
jgi:hypothetical protein